MSIGSILLSKLPPYFLSHVELEIAKAHQLIHNKTSNITENFMYCMLGNYTYLGNNIHFKICAGTYKMDGGKYFNRIQSGSFQHRCMATALWIQHGSGWTTTVLQSVHLSDELQLSNQFTISQEGRGSIIVTQLGRLA